MLWTEFDRCRRSRAGPSCSPRSARALAAELQVGNGPFNTELGRLRWSRRLMDYRVLGPLEVRSERGVVHLGGPKPRAVLAVLLLHANEPVSSARLVEAVWGEDESP